MIYAVSDLHGCYDKFINLLEIIEFKDCDTLYILGDIVDRGADGIKILQYIKTKHNIIPLIGNHDYTARIMLKSFAMPNDNYNSDSLLQNYQMWLYDGGEPTLEAFLDLTENERNQLLSFMNVFQIYEKLEVNGNKFFLSHTIPEKERMDDFEHLMWQEFIVGEPEYDKIYDNNKYFVTGHTPTGLIHPGYMGKILIMNNHIAIDCGAVFEKPLGCIRLDDFKEFYAY